MAKVSSLSRYRFSSSSRSNPVKRSSLLTGNCCLMAVYAHAGKGTLLFPKIPYKSLENSRYETLRRKLKEIAESNVLWSDFAHGNQRGNQTRLLLLWFLFHWSQVKTFLVIYAESYILIWPWIVSLTNLSSLPFCLYCCLPFVLNFPAANLRLHFWRQTGLNPGCCVMHFKVTSALISRRTRSVFIDSRQPSSSQQQ